MDLRSDDEKKEVPGASLVNKDNPQVIEIWNLVFMQYNRKADGTLENLPARHVDTGMGFERLCRVMEGKHSNYDTGIFAPYISLLEQMSGKKYGRDEQTDIAIRVIADHIRAVAFAIADGQLPSNNGAGYVIRRILRRAVRYGYSFLDFREPFFYRLVEVMDKEMGDSFPEIRSSRQADRKCGAGGRTFVPQYAGKRVGASGADNGRDKRQSHTRGKSIRTIRHIRFPVGPDGPSCAGKRLRDRRGRL